MRSYPIFAALFFYLYCDFFNGSSNDCHRAFIILLLFSMVEASASKRELIRECVEKQEHDLEVRKCILEYVDACKWERRELLHTRIRELAVHQKDKSKAERLHFWQNELKCKGKTSRTEPRNLRIKRDMLRDSRPDARSPYKYEDQLDELVATEIDSELREKIHAYIKRCRETRSFGGRKLVTAVRHRLDKCRDLNRTSRLAEWKTIIEHEMKKPCRVKNPDHGRQPRVLRNKAYSNYAKQFIYSKISLGRAAELSELLKKKQDLPADVQELDQEMRYCFQTSHEQFQYPEREWRFVTLSDLIEWRATSCQVFEGGLDSLAEAAARAEHAERVAFADAEMGGGAHANVAVEDVEMGDAFGYGGESSDGGEDRGDKMDDACGGGSSKSDVAETLRGHVEASVCSGADGEMGGVSAGGERDRLEDQETGKDGAINEDFPAANDPPLNNYDGERGNPAVGEQEHIWFNVDVDVLFSDSARSPGQENSAAVVHDEMFVSVEEDIWSSGNGSGIQTDQGLILPAPANTFDWSTAFNTQYPERRRQLEPMQQEGGRKEHRAPTRAVSMEEDHMGTESASNASLNQVGCVRTFAAI